MINKLNTLELINVSKVDSKNNSMTVNFTDNGDVTYNSEGFYVKTKTVRPFLENGTVVSVARDKLEKYLKIFDKNSIDATLENKNLIMRENGMDAILETGFTVGFEEEIGEVTHEFELELKELQKELKYMEKFQSKDKNRRVLMGLEFIYDGLVAKFSGLDGFRAYVFEQNVISPFTLSESVRKILNADFAKAILKLKGKSPSITVKLTEKATVIYYEGLELGGYDVNGSWLSSLDELISNAKNYKGLSYDLESKEVKELLGFLKKIKGVESGEALVVTDIHEDYVEFKIRTKTSENYIVKKKFNFKDYKSNYIPGEKDTKAYNLTYLAETLEPFSETGLTVVRNDSINPIFFGYEDKRAILLPVRLA